MLVRVQGLSIVILPAAFFRDVMLSLSKHLRPFGYAQGDRAALGVTGLRSG